MALDQFNCPEHGIWTVYRPICETPPLQRMCPHSEPMPMVTNPNTTPLELCGRLSTLVISAPAAIKVEGGTGAGRSWR